MTPQRFADMDRKLVAALDRASNAHILGREIPQADVIDILNAARVYRTIALAIVDRGE